MVRVLGLVGSKLEGCRFESDNFFSLVSFAHVTVTFFCAKHQRIEIEPSQSVYGTYVLCRYRHVILTADDSRQPTPLLAHLFPF